MVMRYLGSSIAAALAVTVMSGSAFAEAGRPVDWQLGFQASVTPVMDNIDLFHTGLLWLITLITLLVLGLLAVVTLKFNAKANPVPSKTTHNTFIEIVWTVVPVVILIGIAIPSFRLLYLQQEVPDAALTVKATGSQWYWSYEYPDHDDLSFDAVIKADDELKEGEPRLLATDNAVVVPVNQVVRVIVTASDVLHAWAVPSFGSRIDAVPGRLNETWFKAEKTGVYYGQCSELCGKDHAYMPIEVRVVEQADFDKWLSEIKAAGLETANERLALRMQTTGQIVFNGTEE